MAPFRWPLLRCADVSFVYGFLGSAAKKRVYTTTAGPLFSRSVARPRGHRAKNAMVYTIFLGKQGKRVYTISPERRVYTIEPQTQKKKKRRVSTVVVYTFFFLALALQTKDGMTPEKSTAKSIRQIPAKSTDVAKNGVAKSALREEGPDYPKDPTVLKILRVVSIYYA